MTTYERLLVVQEHDTTLDQLRHRRETLPVRSEVDQAGADVADADARLAGLEERRAGLARDQKRFEDEIATVQAKRAEVDRTLYGGTVTAAKELEALQEEVAALDRRTTSLEDEELEVLEVIEGVEAELATARSDREAAAGRLAAAEATLAEQEAELDGRIDAEQAERDRAAASVGSPEEVRHYEQLRPKLGGVAVARLNGTQCGGCHLALSAVELDRIRGLPADERVTCEECGRLLVR